MNACEMSYDPYKFALQMVQMVRNANVVANLMNVLRMKRENDALVAYLHNIHCMCFSLSLIWQPLSNEFIFYKICTLCPYLSCILRKSQYEC